MQTLSAQADEAPSGSAPQTSRAAFTGRTLTRKSRERPVKGAGAVFSLSTQAWGVLGGSCSVPVTATAPLMSLVLDPVCCTRASPVLNNVHTSLVQNG